MGEIADNNQDTRLSLEDRLTLLAELLLEIIMEKEIGIEND